MQLLPYTYMAEDAGFPKLAETSDYVPDYAFTAIAFNTQWSETNKDLAVASLSALREAVRWMQDNRDEGARMLAAETHASVAHAKRGLFELFEGGASPRDLRISRPALDAVFEAMRDAGLVGRDAALL